MTADLIEQAVALVHTLSSAAWFGALVYRVGFVDPKARQSLGSGVEFEKFSLDLAHGMRYVVLLALVTCGLTGFALMGMRWNAGDNWRAMLLAKIGLWAIAAGLFAYISWVYWPRRVFAVAIEWPAIRRQGVVLTFTMIGIAGLGFLLGRLASLVSQITHG
jgi:putative copper export protein